MAAVPLIREQRNGRKSKQTGDYPPKASNQIKCRFSGQSQTGQFTAAMAHNMATEKSMGSAFGHHD